MCGATRIIAAKILHPVMNIHSVQMMLSAHRPCIFSSNLQRQLNQTLLKADKSRRHVQLIRHNKSISEGCDHVRDYFRCFARLNKNKLSPLSQMHKFMTRSVMKSQESKQSKWSVIDLKVKSPVGGGRVVGVNHCL